MKAKDIRCVECDGWPIKGGSVFISVLLIRQTKVEQAYICELCMLKRLQRRAERINLTSRPPYQINLPDLEIRPRPAPQKPKPPMRPKTHPHPNPNTPRPLHPRFIGGCL